MLTCTCCDGICGPDSGCNCQPCQKLDAEESAQKTQEKVPIPSMESLLNKWAWGPQPCKLFLVVLINKLTGNFAALEQLSLCLLSLNNEQKTLCYEAASSTLSATRLSYRLSIYKRYFIALNRVPNSPEFENGIYKRKASIETETKVVVKDERHKQPHHDPAIGLARVGSRAALNFSFAFLRRAWRLGTLIYVHIYSIINYFKLRGRY